MISHEAPDGFSFGIFLAIQGVFTSKRASRSGKSAGLIGVADILRMLFTIQSLLSFVMRIGGGIAAFGFAPVVQSYGISFTWGLAAAITAGAGLVLAMGLRPRA